jgi:hypothetical protein
VAVLFTKTYGRLLAPGLGVLDSRLPQNVAGAQLFKHAWQGFERSLDEFLQANLVAA